MSATDAPMSAAQRQLYLDEIWPVIQSDWIRRKAESWTRDPVAAEELIADVAFRACRFIGQFREGSNAKGWVHAILISQAANRYGRRRRELDRYAREAVDRLGDASTEAAVVSALDRSEEVDFLVEDLDLIDPKYAEVLRLRYGLVDGLPVDSHGLVPVNVVAGQLGIPPGTVMSRLYRARRAMRRLLGLPAEIDGATAAAA